MQKNYLQILLELPVYWINYLSKARWTRLGGSPPHIHFLIWHVLTQAPHLWSVAWNSRLGSYMAGWPFTLLTQCVSSVGFSFLIYAKYVVFSDGPNTNRWAELFWSQILKPGSVLLLSIYKVPFGTYPISVECRKIWDNLQSLFLLLLMIPVCIIVYSCQPIAIHWLTVPIFGFGAADI